MLLLPQIINFKNQSRELEMKKSCLIVQCHQFKFAQTHINKAPPVNILPWIIIFLALPHFKVTKLRLDYACERFLQFFFQAKSFVRRNK